MKLILEFSDFVQTTRTKPITEEEFLEIFNTNCKNWSKDNDQLLRGNDQYKHDFGFFDAKQIRGKGISFRKWFDEIENQEDKYPVVRNRGLIGLGGGEFDKMFKVCGMLGSHYRLDGRVFTVIPFDNSKIVFAPTMDMEFLIPMDDEKIRNGRPPEGTFTMLEYGPNFKVPSDKLKKIDKARKVGRKGSIGASDRGHGFEFFTSSPCLLVSVDLRDWLYGLR